MQPPLLPPGRMVVVEGRGEFFVRFQPHANVDAPVVLMLHGWTATCDLNFFTAYTELSEFATVVGIDHRGHGRGIRPDEPFTLEDCADDAAGVCNALGVSRVTAVGYSMGGPIAMLFAQRHPQLTAGLVLQATAMEWRATVRERNRFRLSRLLAPLVRPVIRPHTLRYAFSRRVDRRHPLRPHLAWMLSEWRLNDRWILSQAGRSLAHFDARPWIADVGIPVCVVVTTRDQLVPPRKQVALAEAAGAATVSLAGDHFVNVMDPTAFSAATSRAVRRVVGAEAVPPAG